jgi:hypothetical protein
MERSADVGSWVLLVPVDGEEAADVGSRAVRQALRE